jgi:chemotaxis protein methyltransferase CheR
MNTSFFKPATGTRDIGEFELVAKIARENWGLKLDQSKESSILPRLEKRKQALGIDRLSDYCERVSQSPDEAQYFVNALTTNVTHFYREAHHFQDLERNVLIPRSSHVSGGGRLRIWSAGCSSGQEAYSIAGSISATISGASSKDIKILATDIDTNVLRTAALAKYHPSECSFPKDNLENRIFHLNDDGKIVREELRKMVSFRHLNLVKPWPFKGPFDAVFCRNVAIYFERETQERLWSAFANVMREGATLYIGHSERINDPERFDLRSDGITTYRKYR